MKTNQMLGTKTEYDCISKFLELGYMVSLPVSYFSTYDMIVDLGNNILIRVQVKHSSPTSGGFQFHCTSTRINTKVCKIHKYSKDEVDYFATIFDDKLYLVKVTECGSTKSLRIEIPKNFQGKYTNWAVNYEADYVIDTILGKDTEPRLDMYKLLEERKYSLTPTLDPKYQFSYRWITNGIQNKKFYGQLEDIPSGYRLGRC